MTSRQIISEFTLEQGARIGRDQVGRGGRIPIVDDVHALPFKQRFIEMIQRMRSVQ